MDCERFLEISLGSIDGPKADLHAKTKTHRTAPDKIPGIRMGPLPTAGPRRDCGGSRRQGAGFA